KDYEQTPFNRRPIGNGPYRLVEWSPGKHLILERQPFWHGPPPAIRRLVVRILPEAETIIANLEAGRIGAAKPIALEFDLAHEFEQRQQARPDSPFVIHYQPGMWWEHIEFNTENPVTADRQVRQALTLGLNRQAMCEHLYHGRCDVADSWLPPLHPAAYARE